MIYLVEDDNSIRELVLYTLNSSGLEAEGFDRPSAFWAALERRSPDLVILDEPTNALDTDGIELVKKILQAQKARGALVLISCHDLEILRHMSDEIFVLEDGHVKAHLFAPFEEEAS